jgi:hypothetical protein
VLPEPGDLTHPILRDTHCEFDGLDAAGLSERLAAKFIAPGGVAKRLSQKMVTEMAKAELDSDPNGHAAALIRGKQRWHQRISENR